jgi:hypothetical protein
LESWKLSSAQGQTIHLNKPVIRGRVILGHGTTTKSKNAQAKKNLSIARSSVLLPHGYSFLLLLNLQDECDGKKASSWAAENESYEMQVQQDPGLVPQTMESTRLTFPLYFY